jgi:hypothetical protein
VFAIFQFPEAENEAASCARRRSANDKRGQWAAKMGDDIRVSPRSVKKNPGNPGG